MTSEGVRPVLILGLALTLGVAIVRSSTSRRTESDGPLLFRIVLPSSTVCLGDHQLEVESELRNVTERVVTLSPAGIRAQVSFVNRACSLQEGFRTNTISTDPAPGWKGGKVVSLAPGRSYRQTLRLELDPSFFMQGVYRLKIGYSGQYGAGEEVGLFTGTLSSNEALFEVEACAGQSGDKQ